MLAARSQSTRAETSLDLGLSKAWVTLDERGVILPDEARIDWAALEEIAAEENVCFALENDEFTAIRGYSELLQRSYQLFPTAASPALLIAGFIMHRIRDVSPVQGAHAMVKAVVPVSGRLLDTATGLGYAAIEAARHASEVVTIELDPAARAIARQNPWSQALFTHERIQQRIGNSAELVPSFEAESFAAVVHDPPAINLAGELYAETFYAELYRVLQRRGRLFHYIGDPASASGARTTRGVVKRLQAAGFARVVPRPEAFGVLATK